MNTLTEQQWKDVEERFKTWDKEKNFNWSQREILDFFKNEIVTTEKKELNEDAKKKVAEEFHAELLSLVKKYNIKNSSFCGEFENEDKFFGVVGIDRKISGSFFDSLLNVSQLFNSGKEHIKKLLGE